MKWKMEAVRFTSGVRSGAESYQEAAGQSFSQGAPLRIDANGQLVAFVGDEDIIGVANMNATRVQGSRIIVSLATGDAIFSCSVGLNQTTALSDITQLYGLVKDGNLWLIDKTETTNVRVCIVNVDSRDNVGAVNGRLLFVFSPASRQLRF